MLVKLFGIMDAFVAAVIILSTFEVIHSWRVLLVCALYLLIKGFSFVKDVASIIDISVGIYCVMLIWTHATALSVIFSLYLGIKAAMSIL